MAKTIYSLNDLPFIVKPKTFDPTTFKSAKLIGATDIEAFIATSDDDRAVAVDPSLAWSVDETSTPGTYGGAPDASDLTSALLRQLFGPPLVEGTIYSDDFTRADSALTLGGYWLVLGSGAGAAWGIDTNRAKPVTIEPTGNIYVAAVEAYNANAVTRVQVLVQGGFDGIVFRLVPESAPGQSDWSYYRAQITAYSVEIWYANPFDENEPILTQSYTPNPTDWLVVECSGSSVVVRMLSASATEAQMLDASVDAGDVELVRLAFMDTRETRQAVHFGMYGGDIISRFDNFSIAAATPPTPWLIVQQPDGFRVATELEYSASRVIEAT